MATAVEALNAVKPAEGTPDPATTATPAEKPAEQTPAPAAKPAPTIEAATEQYAESERAANAGEVERLREQNRDLIKGQFPEEMHAGIDRVLDVKKDADYIKSERGKIDAEKAGLAKDRVLAEFKEFGITADLLEHCPDEASMRTMAERLKGLGIKPAEGEAEGEGKDENPAVMNEKPSATSSGGAPQKSAVEQFHGKGVEAGMTGFLGLPIDGA